MILYYVIIVENGIYASCALHYIWVIYNLVIQHSLALIRNRTIHRTSSKMTSCHMRNMQWPLKIPSVKYQSRLLVLFYLFTLSLIDGRSLIQSGNGGTFSAIKSCYLMRLLFQNSIYSSRIPKLLTYFSGKTTTAT